MRDYIDVNSSFITSAGYDEQTKTMGVYFKSGSTYNYSPVTLEDWEGFKNAESQGQYLHSVIKQKYTGVQVS